MNITEEQIKSIAKGELDNKYNMKKALRITWHLLPIIITIYILYFKYEIDIIDRIFVLVNILLYTIHCIQSKLKNKK